MTTLKELEKKRNDALLSMNNEELQSYFTNLIKKQVDTLATVEYTKGFVPGNMHSYLKLEDIIQDSVDILKDKRPMIKAAPYIQKWIQLNQRYEELVGEATKLSNQTMILRLIDIVTNIKLNLEYLRNCLGLYYYHYFFRNANISSLLIDTYIPEDEVEGIVDQLAINGKAVSSTFDTNFTNLISTAVKSIECSINDFQELEEMYEGNNRFMEYLNKNSNNDDDILTKFKVFIEEFKIIYDYGISCINLYESYKKIPYKDSFNLILDAYVLAVYNDTFKDVAAFEEKYSSEKDVAFIDNVYEGINMYFFSYDVKDFRLVPKN